MAGCWLPAAVTPPPDYGRRILERRCILSISRANGGERFSALPTARHWLSVAPAIWSCDCGMLKPSIRPPFFAAAQPTFFTSYFPPTERHSPQGHETDSFAFGMWA